VLLLEKFGGLCERLPCGLDDDPEGARAAARVYTVWHRLQDCLSSSGQAAARRSADRSRIGLPAAPDTSGARLKGRDPDGIPIASGDAGWKSGKNFKSPGEFSPGKDRAWLKHSCAETLSLAPAAGPPSAASLPRPNPHPRPAPSSRWPRSGLVARPRVASASPPRCPKPLAPCR
jgi:hypothetical protein